MTLVHPDSADRADPDAGGCYECGNRTFELGMVRSQEDAARVCMVRCAACGDETPFEIASPEAFN